MTCGRSGIRFIDDISAESPAVQDAVSQMMQEMKVERAEEDAWLARAKAEAIAAVENAISASYEEPGSRLAG